jgi:hypothetical protein
MQRRWSPRVTDEGAEAREATGRPAFARDFPAHPELDALVAAFEAGNFRAVRSGASKLASGDADEGVKRAARALLDRTRPDPLATYLLVLTALLLIALTAYWVHHNGAAAPP